MPGNGTGSNRLAERQGSTRHMVTRSPRLTFPVDRGAELTRLAALVGHGGDAEKSTSGRIVTPARPERWWIYIAISGHLDVGSGRN